MPWRGELEEGLFGQLHEDPGHAAGDGIEDNGEPLSSMIITKIISRKSEAVCTKSDMAESYYSHVTS